MNYGYFTKFVKITEQAGHLVVQPRMGFGTIEKMKRGLNSVKYAKAPTIGTLTIDSYTRVNNYEAARIALKENNDLNGYPIVTHGPINTRKMLEGLQGQDFPVQIRHGTALPLDIFKVMLASGIDATEGGPISYCLPYSRVSLEQTIPAWAECCKLIGMQTRYNIVNHLESFAGCMMGQLCPPSLLIALGILEGLFFRKYGVLSMSLSLAQGTNRKQDIAALKVIRQLAKEYLKDTEWHIVFYTYMGVFPKTIKGALELIRESAKIAKVGEAARLIVKTHAEAHRIPTIEENIISLEHAYMASEDYSSLTHYQASFNDIDEIYKEATDLINSVLNLHSNLDEALLLAFKKGYLDVPYCLHVDNKNKSRAFIDKLGYLRWSHTGNMPISNKTSCISQKEISSLSDNLLKSLNYNQQQFDNMSGNE